MAKTKSDPSKVKNKKKKTKSLLSGPAAAAMKSSKQQAKPNPFDSIWTRQKFDVLGKKRKGEERRVGLARFLAIEKRKKTLQKEYEQSTKSSVFVDKRIGEKDDTLQEFDKAVLRLQRERQLKLRKGGKYNLDDGDDHGSEFYEPFSLQEKDDFDEDVPLNDDDALFGSLNGSTSSKYMNLHTDQQEISLADGTENVHKTKKQVMSEIIFKSKFYKAQKAKDKEDDDHLMETLDKDFTSLAQKEALMSLTQPSKINALKAIANKSSTSQPSKGPSSSGDKEYSKREKPDTYDKLVKEMSLDMRARPSDRTKTPEEIAQEERERLETLEEERRKRMVAADDSSVEDDSDGEDDYLRPNKIKALSGDDLGDSFSVEEEIRNKNGWVDDIYENEAASNEDEGSTSSEGSESDADDRDGTGDEDGDDDDGPTCHEPGNMSFKDWEQSGDDELGLDAEHADDADERQLPRKNIDLEEMKSICYNKTSFSEKHATPKQEALPFVIDAPNNFREFCSLLENRSDGEVVEAINRIRACNSIRLSANNREKMRVFYGILLNYYAVSATRRPLNVKILNSLVKPLMEISVETPFFAAICAREWLINIRTKLCKDIKIPEKSSWPSLRTLLLLRLWSLIFPCSDFRHVVMTPAILLMCEYLMRCPIISGRDVAVGSFLCSMALSVAKQSQKFCPEAINFLQTLLMSSFQSDRKALQNSADHLMELRTAHPWLLICDQVNEVHPIDFFIVMDMDVDSPFFCSDSFKASILVTVLETLKGFINIYEKLSAFSEIFSPVSELLHEVLKKANLPSLLQDNVRDIIDLIKIKVDEHQMWRRPLLMRKQKPVPIKLINPKFEESFVKGRDYDPDRERAERKKLKKLLKSEAKGAIRELRKDNHFIFGLKEKDRLQQEDERAEKYGKAMAFLQEQEHAFKSGQLGKGRKRKR
ncbi:uncharacterized protein A4U43_C07F25240 [Asparagus officinalis]|uniref:Nucleolar protein 14 n=1 Tax=Asparagus officinalis TaxID=4686 RepID=A0A5P1EEW5_ASPOF|nr:nucleolar protein 14 [Asparagus officinalis]ONK64384.1 uncharacterized protein A4U43_C07F25240 [Asparagus officinalis]